MILIDVIKLQQGDNSQHIELYQGDLANLPSQEAVDLLILSSFPGDYLPTSQSLIGALSRKGLSVYHLAQDKAVDLRQTFSCWLSQPLETNNLNLGFDRIFCFEPSEQDKAPDIVGDIFGALVPFIEDEPHIRTVAMPIVASGSQGHTVSRMLPPIVESAMYWMVMGIPLKTLKIFAYTNLQVYAAARVFAQLKPNPALMGDQL